MIESCKQTDRDLMVREQIIAREIHDQKVLHTMSQVPRHRFVPKTFQNVAYEDHPIAIGYGQTISQPYIVAYMTEKLELQGHERVLEIGTGSGYQTAILAEIVSEVFSIEIVKELSEVASMTLKALGYHTVQCRSGDGYRGWEEAAPFDAIILTAAPERLPLPLLDQLTIGGRLILPLGKASQQLLLVHRTNNGMTQRELLPVSFVPMTGEATQPLINPSTPFS